MKKTDAKAKLESLGRQKFGDGLTNDLLRLGNYTPNTFNANRYTPEFRTFNRQQLDWMYQSSWICGLAIDLLAEDMTREGIEILTDDAEKADRIDRIFTKYRVWDKLCEGIRWGRLYGGAIAVMMIDGDDMGSPLSEVRPHSFRGLHIFDRWQIQPSVERVQDLGPDFGLPQYYTILSENNAVTIPGNRIHHSRVIRFEGRQLPYFIRQAYLGWGASILEPIYDRVEAFDMATRGAAQLVSKAYLRYYKIQGLRDVLTNSLSRKGFLAQMDAVRAFQGIEGMTLGDKEDEFQVFNYTFTGLPEILLQFGQQISGGIGIPLVRLFGQSPVGFNATGESDLRLYYDDVKRLQESRLRTGLTRLIEVVCESAFGEKAEDELDFVFKPLWQLTTEQRSAIVQGEAGAIIQAMTSGAISTATAMKELKKLSDTVGIFASISDEDIAAAEEEESQMLPPMPAIMQGMSNDTEAITNGPEVPRAEAIGEEPSVVRQAPADGGEGDRPNRPTVR